MKPIQKIAIVGGGFAGWYSAVSLQYHVPHVELVVIDTSEDNPLDEVTVIDSPAQYTRLTGITNPIDLFKQSGGIYKFGTNAINFYQDEHAVSWSKFPNLKIKSLKNFFQPWDDQDFYEQWNRQPGDVSVLLSWMILNRGTGKTYKDYVQEVGEQEYFVNNPCVPVTDRQLSLPQKNSYGYQVNTKQTVQYLKDLVYTRDHSRFVQLKSSVSTVNYDGKEVTGLVLEDGTQVNADLFVDASGLDRILMKTGINNSWTPSGNDYNNSAWVVDTAYQNPHMEITGSTDFHGEDHGWRFKTNLYHKINNGYIFNQNFVEAEAVKADFLKAVGETTLADPTLIQWVPGHYSESWQENVIPVGAADWFIDPYNSPTVDLHSKSLEDLINIIKNWDLIEDPREHFNKSRKLDSAEKKLLLDLTFGLGKRNGPFWQRSREIARKNNLLETIKEILLEQNTQTTHWNYMHMLVAVASGIDISAWNFPELTYEDKNMVSAYFVYTKERNHYISRYIWPNYYEWLRTKVFGNKENHEILAILNPGLTK